jgi:hypothetical protein
MLGGVMTGKEGDIRIGGRLAALFENWESRQQDDGRFRVKGKTTTIDHMWIDGEYTYDVSLVIGSATYIYRKSGRLYAANEDEIIVVMLQTEESDVRYKL